MSIPPSPADDFQPLNQVDPFLGPKVGSGSLATRPSESTSLEALGCDPETGAVPPEHLEAVAPGVTKDEEMS